MIINATPHPITVFNGKKKIIFQKSDIVVRCTCETEIVGNLDGFKIRKNTFGGVVGLPEYKDGVYYIVSAIVKQACPDRHDLLTCYGNIRNKQGTVIGCTGFCLE